MSATAIAIHNPYWDAVRDRVQRGEVDAFPWPIDNNPHRRDKLTSRYAWTITNPATVTFAATHLGTSAIDPLAGTGYWAYLLGQHGVDVFASDHQPPDRVSNHYHSAGITYAQITRMDAVDAVTRFGAGRSLFLAWPPYDHPIGSNIVQAFAGDRIVYVGEGEGGCCGDDAMFDLLAANWVEIAEHCPIQFGGLHDFVTVYDRRGAA